MIEKCMVPLIYLSTAAASVVVAYLDERSHAFGIGDSMIDNKNLKQVEGLYLIICIWAECWIFIADGLKEGFGEKKTKFINASKGARIHSMEEKDLGDCSLF